MTNCPKEQEQLFLPYHMIDISAETVYPRLLSDFANPCDLFNVTLILHFYTVTNLPGNKHAAQHSLIFIGRNGSSTLALATHMGSTILLC